MEREREGIPQSAAHLDYQSAAMDRKERREDERRQARASVTDNYGSMSRRRHSNG